MLLQTKCKVFSSSFLNDNLFPFFGFVLFYNNDDFFGRLSHLKFNANVDFDFELTCIDSIKFDHNFDHK